jgi:ribosomal protein S18 acetylase RimI-like enzyme
VDVRDFVVKPLDARTWPLFARLVEADGGVWGGCWCMAFHPEGVGRSAAQHRADKEVLVRAGCAHAALVLDGDSCAGWCQFGPPAELPRIKARRVYEKDAGTPPDWRITCFYVGKGHRRSGVAATALAGALDQIAGRGGGTVESFPEDVEDRRVSGSFLHNGTLAMFEAQGFERTRRIGKHRWVVTRHVDGTGTAPT